MRRAPCRCICGSPNAIAPEETFTAFLISVLAGARRFAHTALSASGCGLARAAGDEAFSHRRHDSELVQAFPAGSGGAVSTSRCGRGNWRGCRNVRAGYSLDLDSTVFERYGEQEGVKRGYNPRKHGRASHHPLLAVLGEAHFHSARLAAQREHAAPTRGVVEFLKEALAHSWKAGSGFGWSVPTPGFSRKSYCNTSSSVELHYIVVARLTHVAEAGGGAGHGVAGAGRDLRGGRVSVAALGVGSGAALRGGAGATARDEHASLGRKGATRSHCELYSIPRPAKRPDAWRGVSRLSEESREISLAFPARLFQKRQKFIRYITTILTCLRNACARGAA